MNEKLGMRYFMNPCIIEEERHKIVEILRIKSEAFQDIGIKNLMQILKYCQLHQRQLGSIPRKFLNTVGYFYGN